MKKVIAGIVAALAFASCSQTSSNQEAGNSVEVAGLGKVQPVFAYYNFKSDSLDCEISGFSVREDFGRWSCEDTMMVCVKGEPLSEFTVKFNVDIFYNDKHPNALVDVYVGGEKFDSWNLSGATSKYVSLRKDQVAQDGSATITLVALNAMSPEQCGMGLDDRRLCFYIDDITLFGFKAQ